MPDRIVRFLQSFFDDLDSQLPVERSAVGEPPATDFQLYDLPRLRDQLASDFVGKTLSIPGLAPLRMLIRSVGSRTSSPPLSARHQSVAK
jgi:hypothetical protein